MRFLATIFAVALLSASVAAADRAPMDAATQKVMQAALDGPQRTDHSRAFDAARHPLETLKFFGVRRDMAMLEVWPADAWWLEFVGPVIAERGRYVVALDDLTGLDTPLTDRVHALSFLYPFSFGKIEFAPFGPPLLMHPVPEGSIDLAFAFDALHRAPSETRASMLSGVFSAVKPGGAFGVVEARTAGMNEADIIKLIEAAGFKLTARSDINAKPVDGEPARSTLLFQKPQR